MNKDLLELFENNLEQFVSGEEISQKLNCSRTAVWKQIQNLRKLGYEFEAVPRKGYRLVYAPAKLDPVKLTAQLRTKIMGSSLRIYDEVDSTQNLAHELVRQGCPEGTVILAEEQTSGRGRMGKAWHSPKGKGIWMSVILKPHIPLKQTSQLTLLTAVALCRTLRKGLGINVGIKWPNDLLIDGRKISGILLESSGEDDRLNYVVAGIGISVNLDAADFPEALAEQATSLRIVYGKPLDRIDIICRFLEEFEDLYLLYLQQGFSPIRTLWEALTISLNRPLKIRTHDGWIEGTAENIDDAGALTVKTADGERIKLFSGDIQF
ncbi:biotin--[acetyl-CoA-carboxylase] ligase [Paenibacillus sp. J2TS4]|uniref:biotin--[acetyl-CoA-carboxylase] ligase n=1 Tax=Paenibacillus sp. J2TS4 TaxID=2807194 RepID=UPI001B16C5EC|nr:biotin--[acetyl-CoA-carboxylase] ligase [Paenibacillus sp. J2TS4]GIP32424.1 bifunctional ligase/repressor BirA [Paenibacillus sp. J2TS4]